MPTSSQAGLLLVMNDIPAQHEEEFNRWQDEDHVPLRLSLPGFRAARRFRAVDGHPRYLALYELDDLAVLDSEAYRAQSGPNDTAWTHRMGPLMTEVVRNVYVPI